MNPNIDEFPVSPDTHPVGADAPGTEMSMPVPGMGHMPAKESAPIASPQAGGAVVHAASDVALPSGNSVVPAMPAAHPAPAELAEPSEDFEKKWVDAAKAIVEQTSGDPYARSQKLAKAGEEYRNQMSRSFNSDKKE